MGKDDGGYAFPFPHEPIPDFEGGKQTRGMTLRDWLAGMAMQGYLTHCKPTEPIYNIDVVAKVSYEQADAMLLQSRRREEEV